MKESSGSRDACYIAVFLFRMGRVIGKRNANSQRGKCMPRIFAMHNTLGGKSSIGKCYSFGKQNVSVEAVQAKKNSKHDIAISLQHATNKKRNW